MSASVKQVKISTSILWLLNKAQARKVFFSSTDIFSDKSSLQLHSLIVRGLTSGELYSAALSQIFSSSQKLVRTKDFPSLLDYIFELDTMHLEEVDILRQKDRDNHVQSLTKQQPFVMSEHLQIIDAIMAVTLMRSDNLVLTIPTILGKLCNLRPMMSEPKKLLEIWFKSMSCLSLTEKKIRDLQEVIKAIITESAVETNVDYQFFENIRFSDKLALILSYDREYIGVEENFQFQYSSEGSTDRNDIKHNFMTVLNVFRKKFPKVLEDFKELMLMLNSSHVQISSNMLINIDTFMLEFFTSIDGFSNRGNRTFRTGPNNSISTTNGLIDGRGDKIGPMSDKMGSYHSQTINKPPSYFKEQFSKSGVFGTYSGRRAPPIVLEDPASKENSTKWDPQVVGTNLLNGPRKKSLPVVIGGTYVGRMVNSEVIFPEGSLKSMYEEKRNHDLEVDINKTSWLEQLERSRRGSNESSKEVPSDQESVGPRIKSNEARLLLNIKRTEIERNRFEIQQNNAREMQILSDQVFKDVALRGGRHEGDTPLLGGHRPKRVSDMKRNKTRSGKKDLVRSRSQDLSKVNVDEISASLDQLKSQISRLSSEQAKLTARLEDGRAENGAELYSPRTEYGGTIQENDFRSRMGLRSSTRSNPSSWHGRSPYTHEEQFLDSYQADHPRVQQPFSYQYMPSHPSYYPYPPESFQYFQPVYRQDVLQQHPPSGNQYHQNLYHQSKTSRSMAKSVQGNTNSRITSPVAISEPAPGFDEVLSPKKEEEKNEKKDVILTVNNLMKHNESMEVVAQSSLNQEWVRSVSKEDVNILTIGLEGKEPTEEETKEFTKLNKEVSSDVREKYEFTKIGKEEKKDVREKQEYIKLYKEDSQENQLSAMKDKEDSKNAIGKYEVAKIEKDENDAVQTFYVSFNDEESNGQKNPPKKPPKPHLNKKRVPQDDVPALKDNLPKVEDVVTSRPVIKEKPVAFVISVDDVETPTKPTENELQVKEKVTALAEKRELERKEKLEKIRELARVENEKRAEKEMEKEKVKIEKEIKRKAIFEAYLEKKVEKEKNEKPIRRDSRDSRLPKRFNRAVSAAPLQRNGLEPAMNVPTPTNQSPTEMQSSLSKVERPSLVPSNTKLFVAPKTKSNKAAIINAIKYCCLAGKVNEELKLQTIEDLEKCDVAHCIVLMRGGCQYRSLYGFNPESEMLVKISGLGPKKITSKMVERFYKYNSGSKKFIEIDSTNHLSTVIDGITIYNTQWKSTIPSGGVPLSSETSSQAEQISL